MCYKPEPIETQEYKGYTIQLRQDENPDSPREWDNLGTFADFLKREKIGDKHKFDSPRDMIESIAFECNRKDANRVQDLFNADKIDEDEYDARMMKIANSGAVIIPVYAYIHSGITISTGRGYPYNDIWDSGCAGYIYVTYPKLRKEYSRKRITKAFRARIATYLRNEIETLDDYLTGNVCGFNILNPKGESIDSVWGFYPEHQLTRGRGEWDYLWQEARAIVDSYIVKTAKAYEMREDENKEFQYA